ncbi:ISL3 family transposase [Methanoplanus endosymbiosus]|uniref:ISL3 family transposase n=1 Tax=Methanoplanus endosymbiosus TaxID=33865 RepID=A0A9E7PNZ8_9EURY|nr:ISL3 family transposase [Methanoplanus endosymbiosus]UUX92226.1 ISL3 family transposase [Methanoplanus endosymbiosus]UUX93686.1 ISL3 family transposase [Methanoplanus endosymbiosus]
MFPHNDSSNQYFLFEQALGITSPWHIKSLDFSSNLQQIDISVDFNTGAKFNCPICGASLCKVHDTTKKTWRHLDFFQHKAYLHCRVPRVCCETCGVHVADVPWARKGSGFTLLFESMVLYLIQRMPVAQVAEYIGEHDTRLWRIVEYYVVKALNKEDLSSVSSIGIDETSVKKGHNYVTLVVDYETKRVIYVCDGKDSSTLTSFRNELLAHGGNPDLIHSGCCDMSPAFLKGFRESFPDCNVTLDKFHVIKIISDAVDQIRRGESKKQPILKKTKYLWLKDPNDLKPEQRIELNNLLCVNLKTAEAYKLKRRFQELWNQDNPENTLDSLNKWVVLANESKLKPMIRVAKTIKKHEGGILNIVKSGMTNAILEGTNSLIQTFKRAARGYRNSKTLIKMIYLRLGDLNFGLPT